MIELDSDLMNSQKTIKLLDLMSKNLNAIYGYGINDKNDSSMSIYQVLEEFGKYKGKDLKRYKGLITRPVIW